MTTGLIPALIAANRHKLSANSTMVLALTAQAGSIRPSATARMLNVSTAALHSVTDRLVDLGLMAKERQQDDERAVDYFLTEKGTATAVEILAAAGETIPDQPAAIAP